LQHLVTGSALLMQAANLYYATMHFGVLFVFLLWLFLRHRDRYAPVRNTLALTTLACLLIQLVPVAPPRLLPGFVDTAARYGQSVYALGFDADELSAMPSVHVAWAVLVGWYAVRIGRGPWRWLGPAHALLTVLVVVATANHWWADAIVAVAVLCACAWLRHGLALALRRTRRRHDAPPAPSRERALTV
ncbi:MAG: inositol phosphorylceramide synthase, partial [Jatrophihabitans sp.]